MTSKCLIIITRIFFYCNGYNHMTHTKFHNNSGIVTNPPSEDHSRKGWIVVQLAKPVQLNLNNEFGYSGRSTPTAKTSSNIQNVFMDCILRIRIDDIQ